MVKKRDPKQPPLKQQQAKFHVPSSFGLFYLVVCLGLFSAWQLSRPLVLTVEHNNKSIKDSRSSSQHHQQQQQQLLDELRIERRRKQVECNQQPQQQQQLQKLQLQLQPQEQKQPREQKLLSMEQKAASPTPILQDKSNHNNKNSQDEEILLSLTSPFNSSKPQSRWESILYNMWRSIPDPPVHQTRENHPAHRILLSNFLLPQVPPNVSDVVLITHISIPNITTNITTSTSTISGGNNRLSNLWTQIEWWGGPVAVAVYLKSESEISPFMKDLMPTFVVSKNIQVHVVLEKTTTLPYPHNFLRNVVLDHLLSDYFVAMDADFITSPKAHDGLYRLIHNRSTGVYERLHRKNLFVLPAFELFAPTNKRRNNNKNNNNNNNNKQQHQQHEDDNDSTTAVARLPRSKEDVIAMTGNGTMNFFHKLTSPINHGPTRFRLWKFHSNNDTITHQLPFFEIRYHHGFEPYILGYRHGLPRYWDGFRGYGYNKVSWFMDLNARGYRFCTLLDYFVVHLNHPDPKTELKLAIRRDNEKQFLRFSNHYLKNVVVQPNALHFKTQMKKNKNMNNKKKSKGKKRQKQLPTKEEEQQQQQQQQQMKLLPKDG